MRRVRLTIGMLCTGIALLALDIVIWKADLSRYGVWVLVGMRGTLIATTVFVFALASGNQPFKKANQLSCDAALVLMIMLVLIILVGRLVIVRSRHAE